MKKLLNQPWFVALLAVVAIGMIAGSLFDFGGSHSKKRRVVPVADAGSAENEGDEAGSGERTVLSIADALAALKLPDVLPDPFLRRGAAIVSAEKATKPTGEDQTESIHLSAIWIQAGITLALVNNHIMRVGEGLGRLTVEAVSLDGIWVSHWKGRTFVPLGGDFTLVTPSERVAAAASPPPSS